MGDGIERRKSPNGNNMPLARIMDNEKKQNNKVMKGPGLSIAGFLLIYNATWFVPRRIDFTGARYRKCR